MPEVPDEDYHKTLGQTEMMKTILLRDLQPGLAVRDIFS